MTGRGMTGVPAGGAQDDAVEEYLDRLLVTLSGSPRQVRHTLAEIEAHLHDAVTEGIAAGLPETEARAQAVARIGPVHEVTGRTVAFTRPVPALARRLALIGAIVSGVGLVAIAVAGLIGWVLAAAKGGRFIAAPWPPGSYTQADCARWMSGDPAAHNCVAAMVYDHVGDFILQAGACGVLGVLVLTGYLVLRRRWQDRATLAALPAGSAEALGGALAGLAAIFFVGSAIDLEMVQHGIGAGQPFSLAAAALLAAVFFALRLLRVSRTAAT
jgi:hypothetical protein